MGLCSSHTLDGLGVGSSWMIHDCSWDLCDGIHGVRISIFCQEGDLLSSSDTLSGKEGRCGILKLRI